MRLGQTERLLKDVIASKWQGFEGGGLPHPVLLRLEKSPEGRLICTGVIIGAGKPRRGSREVTARELRRIPLGEIVSICGEYVRATPKPTRLSTGAWMFEGTFMEELAGIFLTGDLKAYTGPVARPGPKGYPREHFEGVASAYRDALLTAPSRPIAALQGQMSASEATIRRWVQRARDMGLLGDSIPGKAGERTRGRRGRGARSA